MPCRAESNSGWKAAGLWLSSARYRRWNSFHLTGSWLNQRRRSPLGARFLHQASICNASFFIPRGQRRSTRKRLPSSFADGSSIRLIWITDVISADIGLGSTPLRITPSKWCSFSAESGLRASHTSRPHSAVAESRYAHKCGLVSFTIDTRRD